MRALTISVAVSALIAGVTFAAAAPPSADASATYLVSNAKKPGVVSVPGIQYRVIKKGKGAQPGHRDCATVNYKGSFVNGEVFDQSTAPVTFPVGGVIAGWTEALQMMHEGDEWELTIPSGLAYGKTGAGGGKIPGGATLVFDVTLLKVLEPMNGECPQ